VHLKELFENYGIWVYAILFLIIFCETGLVVTPFLPGDSLLFAAGALTVGSVLDVHTLAAVDHRRGARQRGELHHRSLLRRAAVSQS
jgi:hypothetical protein